METTNIIEKINGFLIEEFEVDPGKITSEPICAKHLNWIVLITSTWW